MTLQKDDPIFQEDIKNICDAIKGDAQQLSGKTILVTGGSGFLGTYLIHALLYTNNFLKTPCTVISIDNHITSSVEQEESQNRTKNLEFITHNVQLPLQLDKKVDYVIHAAGIASPVYYRKYPLEAIDVAVNGTRNMLELAREQHAESMLFFSSSEIYGDPTPDNIPTKETYNGNVSSIGPRACYDESKRLGETLCITYHELYKIPVKITRPFNIYGPGMRQNDYRVIPMFIANALKGSPLPVHEKGTQTRALCYISDAIIGFLKILLSNKNGEVYNVGNDTQEITMNDLANVLNDIFDRKLTIENVTYPKDYPKGEPQRRCPDLTKIKQDVGYVPQVTLHDGLERTIKWCQNNWIL